MGNFRQDFYKWLSNQNEYGSDALNIQVKCDNDIYLDYIFDILPFFTRYGVYIQFFGEKGIYPAIFASTNDSNDRVFQVFLGEDHIETFITMELAMDRSIEEAIKFYNTTFP